MSREELQILLENSKVPSELYNLVGQGRDDERFCLIQNGEQWEVFFKERGVKTVDEVFSTEPEACQFIYEQLVD